MSLSYRNQFIDLPCKSMNWFVYDKDHHHERVKIKVFWIKGYGNIISVHDATKNVLLRESNSTLNMFLRLGLASFIILMKEVTITSVL